MNFPQEACNLSKRKTIIYREKVKCLLRVMITCFGNIEERDFPSSW